MPEDKKTTIHLKRIVTVGQNLIMNREAETMITPKVQCNRALLVDVNQCMHCEFNKGLENQYVMRCSRQHDKEVPKSVTEEPDYEPKKKDGTQ